MPCCATIMRAPPSEGCRYQKQPAVEFLIHGYEKLAYG
eukprot:IDg8369t1